MSEAESIILLVEDDENDQAFIERAFARAGETNRVVLVDHGEAAVAYLQGTEPYGDRSAHPLPRLIITDLKMPKMGGLDLLKWLAQQEGIQGIPAIVLTSSSDEADVAAAFKLGAKGYMIKPVNFRDLEKLARTIADYWRASCPR